MVAVIAISVAGCTSSQAAAPRHPDPSVVTTEPAPPTPEVVAPESVVEETPAPEPIVTPEPVATQVDVTELPTTTWYATTDLNVRSGPGTTFEVIGSLRHSAQAQVVSTQDGWSLINHSGTAAYVSARYLSETAPVVTPVPKAPSAPAGTPQHSASLDDKVAAIANSIGADWGWNCLGTGPGYTGMALENQFCLRSGMSESQTISVAWHEAHHVMLFRSLWTLDMSQDGMEAHLKTLFDPAPLLVKPAGGYPATETIADCFVLNQTGALDSGAYISSCPAPAMSAALAIWGNSMP